MWDSLTVGSVGQGIRRPAQQGEGGAPQEDDEELKEGHDTLYLYVTNKKVNSRNTEELDNMKTEEFVIKAGNTCRMRKNFTTPVNNAGNVKNTPLQAVLRVKMGGRGVPGLQRGHRGQADQRG